jgi:LysM repeat protein
MKKVRPVFLGMIGFLSVLVLMTGCYKPAAPDVEPTSATGAATAQAGEEMPDVMATAAANATLAAQATGEDEATPSPTETPTELAPSPTASPTPEPTAVPTEPAPTATLPPATGGVHVVQPGENLFRIALRYGTTVEAIASANGIANPALINVGQTLTIPTGAQPSPPSPGATTYVVQSGDNLFRIALRYNMSHVYLAQHNNIANPSNIYVGQVLNIPPH